MSIITIILILLAILLYFRCQDGKCSPENILGIIMELVTKMGFLIIDVGSYAIQKFRETNWWGRAWGSAPSPKTP